MVPPGAGKTVVPQGPALTSPLADHRLALAGRLADGLRRRVRYAWRRLRYGRRRPPVEAALGRLLALGPQGDAAPPQGLADPRPLAPAATPAGWQGPSPQFVGLSLETLLWLGCREAARQWAAWLVALQRPDGSLPGPDQVEASFPDTASALRGWLVALDDLPELEQPARQAAAWLRSQLEQVAGSSSLIADPSSLILDLFPLLDAGRRWPERDLLPLAEKLLDDFCFKVVGTRRVPQTADGARRVPVTHDPEDQLLDLAEAQWRRGNLSAASDILQVLAGGQLWSAATCRRFARTLATKRRRGSLPEKCLPIVPDCSKSRDKSPHSKTSPGRGTDWSQAATSRALARLAVLAYQAGLRGPADRALQSLQQRQNPSGGFPRDAGRVLFSRRRPEDPLAVKYYLDAARLRVLTAFETVGQDLPATIDPDDGRVQAAADWLRQLPASARVADVGCGKGRFLKHLAGWFPGAELIGVDISKAMLAQLPPGIRALEGSLLRIPLADGELDGALAVESLEHALLPEQAVAELCRVVRPGGSVLVIDKDRAKQPLSLCDPWERWCTPRELSAWLGRWCEEVSVSFVAHREGRPGRNLFLAARGRRKSPTSPP